MMVQLTGAGQQQGVLHAWTKHRRDGRFRSPTRGRVASLDIEAVAVEESQQRPHSQRLTKQVCPSEQRGGGYCLLNAVDGVEQLPALKSANRERDQHLHSQ